MKRILLIIAATLTIWTADAGMDGVTVSRLESIINQRRLVSTDLTSLPGKVIYTYRQSGVTWSQTNDVKEVNGKMPPIRYSVLKLLTAIADAGRYAEVKAALQERLLPNGMPYWDALVAAQYLTQDDPRLQAGIQFAVQSGLCTQAELDALLAVSKDD